MSLRLAEQILENARVLRSRPTAKIYPLCLRLDSRSIKIVIQMDVLRCKSPDPVDKEIWVHMLAYNILRGLMATAAAKSGAAPRELSFKGTLQALTAFRGR